MYNHSYFSVNSLGLKQSFVLFIMLSVNRLYLSLELFILYELIILFKLFKNLFYFFHYRILFLLGTMNSLLLLIIEFCPQFSVISIKRQLLTIFVRFGCFIHHQLIYQIIKLFYCLGWNIVTDFYYMSKVTY